MRVVAAITVREKSTRLPGKALADIGGLPLYYHIYRRLVACEELDEVVVACGGYWGLLAEDASRRLATLQSFPVDSDLLGRLRMVAKGYHAVARITGDCLFHDPSLVDRWVREFKLRWPSYRCASNWHLGRSWSEGVDFDIWSAEAIGQLHADQECPREDFATYGLSRMPALTLSDPYARGADLKMSIDTPDDLGCAREAIRLTGQDNFSYEDAVNAMMAAAKVVRP